MSSTYEDGSIAEGFFWMGGDSLKVPLTLFEDNRRRLVQALRPKTNDAEQGWFVLLQGGSDQGMCRGDSSDFVNVFRQESFFHWTFGVLEPDFFGGIDLTTGQSFLFMPRLPEDYPIIMGRLKSREEFRKRSILKIILI